MSNQTPNKTDHDDLREEYDFSTGTRGKYASRYREGTNVVVLDSDVASSFPDAESVNNALRLLIQLAEQSVIRNHK